MVWRRIRANTRRLFDHFPRLVELAERHARPAEEVEGLMAIGVRGDQVATNLSDLVQASRNKTSLGL